MCRFFVAVRPGACPVSYGRIWRFASSSGRMKTLSAFDLDRPAGGRDHLSRLLWQLQSREHRPPQKQGFEFDPKLGINPLKFAEADRKAALELERRSAKLASWLVDAHHPESHEVAFGLADRNVFADLEAWSPKRKPCSSSASPARGDFHSKAQVEPPRPPARWTRQALHRRLARPEAVGEALAAVGLPRVEVDAAVLRSGARRSRSRAGSTLPGTPSTARREA